MAMSQSKASVVAPQQSPRPVAEDDASGLSNEGVTRLSATASSTARKDWPVMSFVEEMHELWSESIIEQLEALRDRWFEDVDEYGVRPGAAVARDVSRLLKPHGIYISATHPSTAESEPWEISGPRFYASLIGAARSPSGCCTRGYAPRPPRALEDIVWGVEDDSARPHVTELGWTLVPPQSDPQMLHQDILNESRDPRFDRILGRSRYTHVLWKPRADLGECTTQLVRGGFDRGAWSDDELLYEQLGPAGGACLVLDSEVLHRGAGTLAKTSWTATCTVQMCSTSGWGVLRHLVDHSSLDFTLPVMPLEGDSEGSSDGSMPRKRRRTDPSSSSSDDGERSDSATDTSEVAPLTAGLSTVVILQHEPQCIHKALCRRGWFELPEGLPRAWSSWEVLAFVETYHARWGALVEEEITMALAQCGEPTDANRPGEAAALVASRRLEAHGVAVYVPPPSQSDMPPYTITGPRFYVSVTAAAVSHFGGHDELPPMPPSLKACLWPHADDRKGVGRIRGLGWALSPRHADPQSIHADLWGTSAKLDRVRFPHLLWKRDRAQTCTTEIVPEGFSQGRVRTAHFGQIVRASANAILVDSEVLHRGASTHTAPGGSAADGSTSGWVSSCSVELCSPSGWQEWLAGTGGTVADPHDPAYRMLSFRGDE